VVEKLKTTSAYIFTALLTMAFLFACVVWIELRDWHFGLTLISCAVGLGIYRAFILEVRKVSARTVLIYSVSRFEVIVCCIFLAVVVLGLIYSREHYRWLWALYPITLITHGNLFPSWKKTARFILTSDTLYVNDLLVHERNLEKLHSICLGWTSIHIKVRFVNESDIVLSRNQYNDQELASFIQKIIDLAPVEGEIDPQVQKFLAEHSSTSVSTK
jgi:hypothetical protein